MFVCSCLISSKFLLRNHNKNRKHGAVWALYQLYVLSLPVIAYVLKLPLFMNMSHQHTLQGCSGDNALERQDLPCMYLAQYELESVNIVMVIIFRVKLFGMQIYMALQPKGYKAVTDGTPFPFQGPTSSPPGLSRGGPPGGL